MNPHLPIVVNGWKPFSLGEGREDEQVLTGCHGPGRSLLARTHLYALMARHLHGHVDCSGNISLIRKGRKPVRQCVHVKVKHDVTYILWVSTADNFGAMPCISVCDCLLTCPYHQQTCYKSWIPSTHTLAQTTHLHGIHLTHVPVISMFVCMDMYTCAYSELCALCARVHNWRQTTKSHIQVPSRPLLSLPTSTH